MTAGDGNRTLSGVASAGLGVAVDLPSAGELVRLPANHRRVVAALLATLSRHVAELSTAGTIAASAEAVRGLTELVGSLGPGPPEGRSEALRQALLVQLDDIEPVRLGGYGPLNKEQEATLNRLVTALRAMLKQKSA